MKKIKKLFVDRQLRDICMSDPAQNTGVIKAISDDLHTRYNPDGEPLPFDIEVKGPSTVRITYGVCLPNRSLKSDEGYIPEDYTWLYTGEWKDWKPRYMLSSAPSFGGYFHFDVAKENFYESIRENNKYMGGNRIKSIDAGEDTKGFYVEITFG